MPPPVACRERILLAIETRLAAIATSVPGLTVERDREEPVETKDMPRLVVTELGEVLQGDLTGEDGWTLTLAVAGYVRGATGANDAARAKAAAAAANDLRARAQAALRADVTLGGLARDLRPAAEAEAFPLLIDCADPAKAFATPWEVDYATEEGDPYTFATHV
ncbi:hypothetical protein STVA_41460 [Allostella vacuolata]|nr:hypothetical protein STVA_41460 [Stella vacuolata]